MMSPTSIRTSAIIPVFNTAEFLPARLDSLEPDFEPTVFVATDVSSGTLYRNRPVIPITDAGNIGLEHLVVASSRYHLNMESAARRYAPSTPLSSRFADCEPTSSPYQGWKHEVVDVNGIPHIAGQESK